MNDDTNNITSIHSAGKSSSGAQAKGSKSKYIPPSTSGNPTSFFKLPNNAQLIQDFKKAGGSLQALLSEHITDVKLRKMAAIQIIEQLSQEPEDKKEFDDIRISAEKAEALLAKDLLVIIAHEPGQSQISALKLVREFVKDHPKEETTDPIDSHLEGCEEDEE